MLRERDKVKIKVDAIRMGVKKAAGGCGSCAEQYFRLAEQSGATGAEIEAALRDEGEKGRKYLTRREVLKGLAIGVAGTAAVASGLVPLEAAATVNSFGVDTNTVNCCSMPYTFYIGRFGGELTSSTSGFNVTAARQAGIYYSYIYWDIGGPVGQSNPYSWGYNQANAAISSWYHNPNAPYAYGWTIFGDIEPGNGGWGTNQGNNQQVLQGWIDAIVQYNTNTGTQFVPGVYISPANWNSYFGSSFRTSGSFALWVTGCYTCSISCPPADPYCSGTTSQVENRWNSSIVQTVFGGSFVQVWQYWIGTCAYGGDWDYSLQTCYKTIPAESSTNAYVSNC
jgi:hypothetical protein